jgi:hypothetical protein
MSDNALCGFARVGWRGDPSGKGGAVAPVGAKGVQLALRFGKGELASPPVCIYNFADGALRSCELDGS